MRQAYKDALTKTNFPALLLGLFAVVCLGQSGLTRECKADDYICRYNNYTRIVFAKCKAAAAEGNYYDCFVAEQTKIVESNPNDIAAYIFRGIIYSARDPDRTIADFNKVLEFDPKYEPAYTALASAYEKKGERDRALTVLSRGVELFPKGDGIYDFRGNVYLEQGDYAKSLADFDKVIELEPNSDRGYIGRSDVYAERRDYGRAIAEYDKAIGGQASRLAKLLQPGLPLLEAR